MQSLLTRVLCSAAIIAATVCGNFARPAAAYSPTHPTVEAMVAKARGFLSQSNGSKMGESALIALALIKSGSSGSDPKVQEGVAAIRRGLQDKGNLGSPVNYNVAVSIIFLVEFDPITYRSEVQALLDILLSRQEGHGGWSYWPGEGSHTRKEGDSSMTQYATLALWSAKKANFNVPQEAAVNAANFWMRTQTPQGGWGYQGHVAPLGQRQNQSEVRPSIAVAGLGSCYVLGELFGLARRGNDDEPKISGALQKVQQKEDSSRYFSTQGLDVALLRQTMGLGDRFISQVSGYEDPRIGNLWIVYYMYAMERYRSFQEIYQGNSPENAKWYDDGVEFLAKHQNDDGGWTIGAASHGHHVSTSFIVLFLTRSTKKSLQREFGDGLVRGGRGLPSDIGNAVLDEATGHVIDPDAVDTVKQLITILEDPNNSQLMAMSSRPASLDALVRPAKGEDEVAREQRIKQLKDMVSQGSFQQRLVAVKALARTGDLDQVPLLLYAMTDPDPRVVRAADEGLRFISRKLSGFGSLEEPEKVRQQWRKWYLAIRPDAELLE